MPQEKENDLVLVQDNLRAGKQIFESVVIKTEADLAQVSDEIKKLKGMGREIEERKEKFTGPAKAIIAQAKETYDEAIAWFKQAERDLKARAATYMLEQERIKKEKEAKIARDLEAGKIDTEKAMKKMEKLPDIKPTTDTGSSKLQMKKVFNPYIVEPSLIPDEFWIIDESKVKREAKDRHKNNLPQIPGVEMREEAQMASL